MALIKCHECSGQISDHARTCPHCGAPVIATIKRRRKSELTYLLIRVISALIIGITFWIWWQHQSKSLLTPLKAPDQKQTNQNH